jgi:hypothetical protein
MRDRKLERTRKCQRRDRRRERKNTMPINKEDVASARILSPKDH